jgi:hypothetical protein
MVQQLLGRKGAARIALIPPEVLEALNEGVVATVNLNEFLALDLPRLTRNVARHIGLPAADERIADTLAMLGAFRPVKRHEHVARALYDLAEPRGDRDAIAHALATRTRATSRVRGRRSGSRSRACRCRPSSTAPGASLPTRTSACAKWPGWPCATK